MRLAGNLLTYVVVVDAVRRSNRTGEMIVLGNSEGQKFLYTQRACYFESMPRAMTGIYQAIATLGLVCVVSSVSRRNEGEAKAGVKFQRLELLGLVFVEFVDKS